MALICGCAVLIYGHSLTNGFVWDDNRLIWNNPSMVSWAGIKSIWSSIHKPVQDHPLTLSFFWLEHKLWGNHPWGYHVMSLSLHILNALLLFGLVVRRLTPTLAGIIALVYTIHPIQVETVAWASEQKSLLCLLFLLLAFHSMFDFDQDGKRRNYFKMLLFFTAAFLSKQVASCFAVAPLIHAWWTKGTISKRDLFLILPLLFLGGATSLLMLHAEMVSFTGLPALEKIIRAGQLFFFYITQVLIPKQFMTLYPKWNVCATCATHWLYPAGALGLYLMLFVNHPRIGRGAFALLCYYGIAIFPALGFFDVPFFKLSYATDHYSYFAVPPLLILFGLLSRLLFLRIKSSGFSNFLKPSLFLKKSLAIIAVVYLSLMSFQLTFNYKDDFSLWRAFINQNPRSASAYYQLGSILIDSNNIQILPDVAIGCFQKAVEIDPNFDDAYNNLGHAFFLIGENRKAAEAFQHSVKLNSKNADSYHGLSAAILNTGDRKGALVALYKAHVLAPQDKNIEENLRAMEKMPP